MGPEIPALEVALAQLMGLRHGVACASGTDALLLPFRAIDLAAGDEVIAPAFTFFATAGAIHNAGGKPVFVDIEADTFNISPAAIEAAITPRTKAIVVVHLFGQMAAMEAIAPIAAKHGLKIIEDGAQSIGARRKIDGVWRMPGQLGTVATLSFFPTKNLGGWGDGGMMLTDDDALASPACHAPAARRRQAVSPRRGRLQLPARFAAGGGAAGQAAAPAAVERGASCERRLLRHARWPGSRRSRLRWSILPMSTSGTSTPSRRSGGMS